MTDAPNGYVPFPSFADFSLLGPDLTFLDEMTAVLADAKAQHDAARFTAAVREMSRTAAVDTNAIEGLFHTDRGFTRTVATEASAWQAAAQERGEHVLALITSAVEAYDIVLDAATGTQVITEVWIRQLHEVLCQAQATFQVMTATGLQTQPLPTGQYKTLPNNPTSLASGRVHHYAPPDDTPAEMQRLISELRSPEFGAAHPVQQAAYAHYAFVRVHPFADGNGRVSRALASAFLYRQPGVPLVVYADQREQYLDALEQADAGDAGAFVDFVAQRVFDVVELIRLTVESAGTPTVAESVTRLRQLNEGAGGLPHVVVDALARRLHERVGRTVEARLAALELPDGVSIRVYRQTDHDAGPPGYRKTTTEAVFLVAQNSAPATAQVTESTLTYIGLPATDSADFLVVAGTRALPVRLRDVHPMETQLLVTKVDRFVSAVIDHVVADLITQAQISLDSACLPLDE